MHITKKILAINIMLIAICQSQASAGIIFEDNFDSSPDWQSNQTVFRSEPGAEDISWPATYKIGCATNRCPPKGWTSYRAPSSQWTENRGRDTFVLDSTGARGESGKGITYNVESRDSYGDWSGGSLDVWLGHQGYQELYIRMYVKYSNEWLWGAGDTHGQQKLIRISSYHNNIDTADKNTISPQYFDSTNSPVWYPDWYYSSVYDYGYFFSSTRTEPAYASDGDNTYTDVPWPTDAGWHCYEFHVKMNSSPGVADGVWEFYLDGILVKSRSNVTWKQNGAGSLGWNWLMVMDNITVATYPASEHKEMAIYMDDFVVSTNYIGPDGSIHPTNKPSKPIGFRLTP